MNVDIKESALLKTLSKNDEYVSAGELAESLGVSTKTIHRMIKSINDRSDKMTILSKVGKGFKLADENVTQECHFDVSEKWISPRARRNTVILKLLFKSPLKQRISNLFENFYLSSSSVKNDIQIISDFLNKKNITLNRKGDYIWVFGDEANIRNVINKIIFDSNMEYQIKQNEEQIIPLLYNYDLNFARRQIEYIEEKVGVTLLYPYNINLIYHICMLIKRFHDGKVYQFLDKPKKEICKTTLHQNLYEISEKVVIRIEKYLNQKLPKEEILYIYAYLASSRFQERDIKQTFHEIAGEIVDMYIDIVGETLRIHFGNNSLGLDLYEHVVPMLERLSNQIQTTNNLLKDIQTEYSKIFDAVLQANKKIEKRFNLPHISKEETGYIVLYFARCTEYLNRKFKICIICTSGLGTSELLKAKVGKSFSNVIVNSTLSTKQLRQKVDLNTIDFILSTVDLKDMVNIPYLVVNALFLEDDKRRVEILMKEIIDND